MNEARKAFEEQQRKLDSLCGEQELSNDVRYTYPLQLTIRPFVGVGSQLKIEDEDGQTATPDSTILMDYVAGEVTYTFTGSYRIAKTTLDKLQKAFKSLCEAWLYLVFCEVCTENPDLIDDLNEDN